MGYKEDTLNYYNNNAEDFVRGTLGVDMTIIYDHFEGFLKPGATILDLGCGSGRDSKYFVSKGYCVLPVDGSEELCKIASEVAGVKAECVEFSKLDYLNSFDAIWVCASLLHLDETELKEVIAKLHIALKQNGIIYASFKYGEGTIIKGERFFFNCDESKAKELFGEENGFKIIETFITTDVRTGRDDEKWINIIASTFEA